METRVSLQEWLQECENTHFGIEVVDSKTDEAPFMLKVSNCDHCVEFEVWLRESDINQMQRILSKAKKERKRLLGEK